MTMKKMARAAMFFLSVCILLFLGCKQNSPGSTEETTDGPGTGGTTTASMEGAWLKTWTSDYQYDSNAAHLCTAILAEYSGTAFTLSFYRDTVQVFGLKGSFTKTGDTSGTLAYAANQAWNSSTKKWEAGSSSMTQTYSSLTSASAAVSDWNNASLAYAKITFSRPSALVGYWGGSYDSGSGSQNTSMSLSSAGVYEFYQDGSKDQTGTWQSGTVSGGSLFIRTPVTQDGAATGVNIDFLTPYALAGSVMTCKQGSNPDYVVTKAVTLAGTVSTFAGNATHASIDGTGTGASFYTPYGACSDGTYLYVTDMDKHVIRRLTLATGLTETVAGTSGSTGSNDAAGASATFNTPKGITCDDAYLYVADSGNHTIRRIDKTSFAVTTPAGLASTSGITDGTGSSARFTSPEGIASYGDYLYVADTGNYTIRKIVKSTAVVTTIAGIAASPGTTDAASGLSASFQRPVGLASDDKFLYVADSSNPAIRRIDKTTTAVTTIAGAGLGSTNLVDGIGAAAWFYFPQGVTDAGAYLYIADTNNQAVRIIDKATREVKTLAGNGSFGYADGTGASARFYYPYSLAYANGAVYVTDTSNYRIRKVE